MHPIDGRNLMHQRLVRRTLRKMGNGRPPLWALKVFVATIGPFLQEVGTMCRNFDALLAKVKGDR